jgi:hypothetical protein
MSFNITGDADYLGGIDYSDLTKIGKFQNALVITKQIQANTTEEFKAEESEDIVKSIEKESPNAPLPGFARLIDVKLNIRGNSSDVDVEIFQSETYREIDRVVKIREESVSDSPSNYTLGAGIGVPYVEKDGGNQIYFRVEENSGSTCEVDIEFNWLNIRE